MQNKDESENGAMPQYSRQEITLPVKPGYAYTGDYREPRHGEWFIDSDEQLRQANKLMCYGSSYFIMRREATRVISKVYYCISTAGRVLSCIDEDSPADLSRWRAHNYFTVMAEAEAASLRYQALLADIHDAKWKP